MKLKIETDNTIARRLLGAVFWTLVGLVLGAYLAVSVLLFLMRGPQRPQMHQTDALAGAGYPMG